MRAEEEHGKMIIALTLKVDQFALERDQASTKLEQANAKIDLLVKMLKDKGQDKADIDKVLKFYDNPHTPPSHRTIHPAGDKQGEEGGTAPEKPGGKARPQGRLQGLRSQPQVSAEGAAQAARVLILRRRQPEGDAH